MFRSSIKRRIVELAETLLEMHKNIPGKANEEAMQLLIDCQGAAVAIGDTIDEVLPDRADLIKILEQYCEEVFLLSEKLNKGSENRSKGIRVPELKACDRLVNSFLSQFRRIKPAYQVVFFPYKAAMWDSLESIYLAARTDEGCEALVIPIPYYQYDKAKDEWIYTYEGGDLPADIPTVYYKDYDLEDMRPDVAYIHNPYDQYNYVTHVEETYYSENLKKYVGKLVYSPYYVTGGFITQNHTMLSAYTNMDYMVAQSDNLRDGMKGLPWYDKLIVLGSPKIDRVIRMCRDGVELPAGWAEFINNRPCVMLNTSLNCFLADGDIYLDKLYQTFCTFRDNKRAALIWRPHPLLYSTIRSMRPELEEKFQALLTFFRQNEIGIYDETPDISATVAIADAYIGETSSSVINLFGAAGKPIFILNNLLRGSYSDESLRVKGFGYVAQAEGITYSFSGSRVFTVKDCDLSAMDYKLNAPEFSLLYTPAISQAYVEGRIYFAPWGVRAFSCYNIAENKVELLPGAPKGVLGNICDEEGSVFKGCFLANEVYYCRNIVEYKGKLFYFSILIEGKGRAIASFDINTCEWETYVKPLDVFKQGFNGSQTDCYDIAVVGGVVWITSPNTHQILGFNMGDESFEILNIDSPENRYTGITADESERLYMAEARTGDIFRLDKATGKLDLFKAPEGFVKWYHMTVGPQAHQRLYKVGPYVVTEPGYCNAMMRLDTRTGETDLVAEEFFKDSDKMFNGYHPLKTPSGRVIFKKDEEHLVIQRYYDGRQGLLNIITGDVEIFEDVWSDEELAAFRAELPPDRRFDAMDPNHGFYASEDGYYTLERFLGDLCGGHLDCVRERQLESLSGFCVNLDGTCGEKTHRFVMDSLK